MTGLGKGLDALFGGAPMPGTTLGGASEEISEEEIKEFVQNNRTIDFIYMPNTI